MTAASPAVTEEKTKETAVLEADARSLAEVQRNWRRAPRFATHFFEPPRVTRRLERAQKALAGTFSAEAKGLKAAEWFLDNYYLIRRVGRQVEQEFPRGFVRHLPQLAAGPAKGRPRILVLARALVAKSAMTLDLGVISSFISSYQTVSPLTIAELWALPTMLRSVVLVHLLQFVDELGVANDDEKIRLPRRHAAGEAREERIPVEPGAGVEESIRALRVLECIDWKCFFESMNRVEAILRKDPAGIYASMDFETCDTYRKVVEQLAWDTGRVEEDVANLVVGLAANDGTHPRRGHVGYYLIAEGQRSLNERLGHGPIGLERIRRLLKARPTTSYLLPLAILTTAPLLALGACLARAAHGDAQMFWIAVAAVVGTVPTSALAVAFLHAVFARLLPPQTLPKLDFTKGLPKEARTLVVIPTLLGRAEDVTAMVRQIEIQYLSNPDPQLGFALLTDHVDRKTLADTSQGPSLLESASQQIGALNAKHGRGGRAPFHLLHRETPWNPSEDRFMGWERKRGKLEELNRLLRGDKNTSYSLHVGDPAALIGIRCVITLDSDTQLPMGSASRLVGLLLHPLNLAVFDAVTGRVLAGYTIAQPRIETSPSSLRLTRFSRIFAGDVGLDIYTHACSELYQDLFGSGIYVGKGIYEIDAFMRSVAGSVPENALVSHDLFEGIHGRTALASDISLFEGYPSNYPTYALRLHRWVRGDWQLLPWLFPNVPCAGGGTRKNSLNRIDRWKIADNLRRSLTSPLLLVLFVLGWAVLPGNPEAWTLGLLALSFGPFLPALADGRRRVTHFARFVLAVAFLAYEASVAVDAIVRVFVRTTITHKRLLQWTSAAHAAFNVDVDARSSRAAFWQTMIASPLIAAAIGALLFWARPSSGYAAAPLLLVWFFAPEAALWASKAPRSHAEHVTEHERKKLRLLARRTWRFFETFVGPNDQWLPIDNYQEEPHEQTAHRTSPTNIGLMLVATLSAYDFGYIGPSELSLRLRRAFDSITRLPHYQGHLLNWYDTTNLQPLLPRYVSTVDSGNWAGCLLALKQGCREVAVASVDRVAAWDGLADSIDLLEEVLESVPLGAESIRLVISRMREATRHGRTGPGDTYETLRILCDETSSELDREVLAFLETGAARHEADLLRTLRTTIDQLRQQLHQMRRELDALLPWLRLRNEASAHAIDLPADLRLDEIPGVAKRLLLELEAGERLRRHDGQATPESDVSAGRLEKAFRGAESNAVALMAELASLASSADDEVRGMDFKLLYDSERKLFHIGYNATTDQLDPNRYDLLASEARLASYVAIIKRDVPEEHWYALGRPMTQMAGAPMLLSWGGTMFEYLMPGLLMRSQEGTLLSRTSALAVSAQIAYGRHKNEPWGISESAYARVDAEQTYQYRSFGVPGLGFRRGLEEDNVVTPYASVLAVSIRPQAVFDNVVALEKMGMLGSYGLFEALDLTADRTPRPGERFTVVRSYMAHHQGMLLVALGNFLNARTMVDRFHSDAWVETGDMLLNERAPDVVPAEWPLAEASKVAVSAHAAAIPRAPIPWSPKERSGPQAFVLSNGRLACLLTGSGGGALSWRGLAVTRYEPDGARDADGIRLYLRDEVSRQIWLATSREGRTTFAMHKVDFLLRNHGISVHVDVAIAATDDVEVRQVTLHNETNRVRSLTVTTEGRPVLFDAKRAPTHPAFSSLFVESERVAELDALLFARRPQSAEEEPAVLVHRLVCDGPAITFAGFESDRSAFFGRGHTVESPAVLEATRGFQGHVGQVLDPVMSLTARVELEPMGAVKLAFVTTVARSRGAALDLARKYGSMDAVRWTFRDAEQESSRRLQSAKIDPGLLPAVQHLFSALVHGDATLRAPRDVRAIAPACQRRLWGRGISGDDPIVLLRVHDPMDPLVAEILAAQRFLRACGVRLDLVIVDEHSSGYFAESAATLRRALTQNGGDEWFDRHGGIFVVSAEQVPGDELRHLEACARILLDTGDGTLAERLERAGDGLPVLPQFEPTLVDTADERPCVRPALSFDNGVGGFTEDGRQYVVLVAPGKPTPAPWCNVLANPAFGCLVSESSLGMSWSLNSGENRLTPWRNDPVFDAPSEALYLRDEETAAVWSPTPLPAGRTGQTLVRHGAGYTIYERESHGLVQELTIFVPPGASLKVVRLRLKNTMARHRRLTATYYAEWVLGSRREAQRPFILSEFDRDHACLLATCSWNAEFSGRVAFLAAKDSAHGFTADRTEFLGRRGDYSRPEGLERWGLSGRVDRGDDPCAALQVHIDIAPAAEIETHFILGQSSNHAEALALVARFRSSATVDAAWNELRAFWEDILGNIRVKTPEPSMDPMLNRWLLYQTLSSRLFGRTGFYQSSGAFGYRDQLQDVLALLHAAPAMARAHILEAAKHQFEQGDVLHWWHPPSGRGVRTRCSDDMAWLAYVTAEYVAATGDVSILEESVSFLDGAPLRSDERDRYAEYAASGRSAPLFEHCRRALEHALTKGVHELPLMGDGDWNDGFSRVGAEGRGESIWLGWFLCKTMHQFAALAAGRDDESEAAKWVARTESLRAKIADVAWDGRWFVRAFHDDGSILGSAKSRECRIDSIAQSWAVLSEPRDAGHTIRARAAVGAADDELVRFAERLVLLFWPPFETTLHDPGYVRAYPPGIRENGGQYTHAATWLGFAHAALGDGERAERIFRLLNPVLRVGAAADVAQYRVEPYALAGDVYSCSPWVGRGGWSWYTGAAAWMWRLGVEEILGIRRDRGHLRIDPCIPPSWAGFEAWVRVGQQCVHIVVANPDGVTKGIAAMTLDGASLDSTRICLDAHATGTREVHVRLGSKDAVQRI